MRLYATIFCGILAAGSAGPVAAQGQVPVLDQTFGGKKIETVSANFDVGGFQAFSDGSFYVASMDALTRVKPDGSAMWSVLYPQGFFHHSGVVVDQGANAYVAVTDLLNNAAMVLKYSPSGVLARSVRLDYPAAAAPAAWGIAGNNGGIYVAAEYYDQSARAYSVALHKFDAGLNLLKSAIVPAPAPGGPPMPGGGNMLWGGIELDSKGGLYFVRNQIFPQGPICYKYDEDLNLEWKTSVGGSRIGVRPFNVTVIPSGGMYFSWLESVLGVGVMRLAVDGSVSWVTSIPSMLLDFRNAVDDAEDLYVKGLSGVDGATWLQKLNGLDGNSVWMAPIRNAPVFTLLYIDGKSRIYVVSESSGGNDDGHFLSRYVLGEDSESKYSLSMVGAAVPQIVNVGAWSAPQVSLVSSAIEPVSGAKVDFSVSTWPAGAEGQELSKSSETTKNGLADVLLKLGNIPAEYGVAVTCPSCEAGASSHTFTCCGKLPNDDFKQYDVRWATHPYNTQTATYHKTLRRAGCAVSSLATLINYYSIAFPGLGVSTTTPKQLNDVLEGQTNPKGFDSNHDIKFDMVESSSVSNGKITYSQRTDYEYPLSPVSVKKMRKVIDAEINKGSPVIIVVRRSDSSETEEWTHFMLVVGKCGSKYIVSDPASFSETSIDPTEKIKLPDGTFVGPVISVRKFLKIVE